MKRSTCNTNRTSDKQSKEDLINSVITCITHGKSKGAIIDRLVSENKIESIEIAHNLIQQALDRLNEMCNVAPQETIKAHIQFYELIFDYFKKINHTQGANRALRAKERLKGIFQNPKMTINQNIKTTINVEPKYDTSRLAEGQLTRLEFLLSEAKKV